MACGDIGGRVPITEKIEDVKKFELPGITHQTVGGHLQGVKSMEVCRHATNVGSRQQRGGLVDDRAGEP